MKRIILFIAILGTAFQVVGQVNQDSLQEAFLDSIQFRELGEVVVISNATARSMKDSKALGSLDNYLKNSSSVNMVRRGAYAWEPLLNGMATERSVITVDGMRIYHACTNKMDPVTSYVENTNLSKANINDGQSGAEHGGTIAGSIDLVRRKSGFKTFPKFGGSAFAGFESNNMQQIYGATLNYGSPNFFTDVDFTYRDAENYKAGQRSGLSSEVLYSQFTKYNLSAISGFKFNDRQHVEASVIFDKATNVGYPGLPMDVALAQATIASLQHSYRSPSPHVDFIETKAYYNTITHIMDDSRRPVVPIRMDMPGWSKTAGFYSKLAGNYNRHTFKATLSGHLNNSLAEMTMHPNNPNEADMYMLTWPDVNTIYAGINIEDNISLNDKLNLSIQGGIGGHYNEIRSETGLNSLHLFYPDLKATKLRSIKNLSGHLQLKNGRFQHKMGIGYGDRAPSVSEAYGFYLYNVNDNYDYIGNPNMKNEKSFSLEVSSGYTAEKISVRWKANYFYIKDYIIGKPQDEFFPMYITASGVKVYQQLEYAGILNTAMNVSYNILKDLLFQADASYRYGQGAQETILPSIQPLGYSAKLKYQKNSFFAEAGIEGCSKNRNSPEFGEIQKPAYMVANVALSNDFSIGNINLVVKLGVENLFDKYYSTFDDWFGIPKMGRNIFTNVIFKF